MLRNYFSFCYPLLKQCAHARSRKVRIYIDCREGNVPSSCRSRPRKAMVCTRNAINGITRRKRCYHFNEGATPRAMLQAIGMGQLLPSTPSRIKRTKFCLVPMRSINFLLLQSQRPGGSIVSIREGCKPSAHQHGQTHPHPPKT